MESANSAQTSPRLIFVYLTLLLEINTFFNTLAFVLFFTILKQ